ncbi:MAG TPA: nuclear transport factor 2 family protein [Luteimonas sp.]|nr:nuclear transport factor 2 family protein [Luteimonas sp.]
MTISINRPGNGRFRILAVTMLACLVLLLAACSRTPPEEALRATVADMQSALEDRDAAAMQQHLAEDFVGNEGLDRDGARRLAALHFLRHRDIGVTAGPLDVQMTDTHATVRFTAMLRGGSGGALPDSARMYDVETGWRLVDGDWKLASARWAPVL